MSNSKSIEVEKPRHVSVCEEATESLLSNNQSNIQKRNYILNESNALKKKLKHENRNEPFNSGTEARDGSNVVLLMRTSFFEHTKSQFIKDITKNADIVNVDNALGSKVSSANSGEAFVEYSADVTFKLDNESYIVKLTAYTTSCTIMVQPVGQRVKLGTKSIPRYFVDNFILPWCHTAYANKSYKEKEIIDAVHT